LVTATTDAVLGAQWGVQTAAAQINVADNALIQGNNTAIQNQYYMGYHDGYNDGVNLVSPADKCIGHVQEYCNGFNAGFYSGNGNSSIYYAPAFRGTDFGNLSDLASIPIVGGMIASHSKITNILHNEQGVFLPWSFICNKGQAFILQSCSGLVNSDGSLTKAGDTAVGCIRNGIAAVVGAKQNNIPLDLVKSVLNFAAPLTGCGGIVNLDTIQNEPQFQSILNAITQ